LTAIFTGGLTDTDRINPAGICAAGQLLRSERAQILYHATERGGGDSGGNSAGEQIKWGFAYLAWI